MKNPQEDDAVERMLNQLEGLLKRQHDTARASRGALVPIEDNGGEPFNDRAEDNFNDRGEAGFGATSPDGDGSAAGIVPIELESFDPDATAPEMNAYPDASGNRPVDTSGDRAADAEGGGATAGEHISPAADDAPVADDTPVADDAQRADGAAAIEMATDERGASFESMRDRGSSKADTTAREETREQRKLAAVPARVNPAPVEPDGAHMNRRLTTRLGQLLLDADLLSEAQLKDALERQHKTGQRLGSILVTGGYIDETALLAVLSKQHGVPTAKLDGIVVDPVLTEMIPADMARRYQLVPIAINKDAVDVAMVDPTDFVAMAHIRFATGLRPNVFVTTATAADRAMARLYAGAAPEPAVEQPREPRAEIKKMILDRDALLIGAEKDPRKFYELAASIDAFVDEIIRKATS